MSFPAISFLIISKDNCCELVRTFNSIYMQMSCFDEILIVDSSSTSNVRNFLSTFISAKANINMHIPPNGVYDAQNHCVSNAKMIGFVLLTREISYWNLAELLFRHNGFKVDVQCLCFWSIFCF